MYFVIRLASSLDSAATYQHLGCDYVIFLETLRCQIKHLIMNDVNQRTSLLGDLLLLLHFWNWPRSIERWYDVVRRQA